MNRLVQAMNQVAPTKPSVSDSATSQKEKTSCSDGETAPRRSFRSISQQLQDELSDRPPPEKKQKGQSSSATSQPSQSEQPVHVDRFTLYRTNGTRKTFKEVFGENPSFHVLHEQFLRAAGKVKPDLSAISQEGYPSEGSKYHGTGWCWPCKIFHTNGCKHGQNCNRCHICPQYEEYARESLIKRLLTSTGKQEDLFEEYAEIMVFGNAENGS